MKVLNKSSKIIGFGEITILPDESKDIPVEYEKNPILEFYKKKNLISISGEPSVPDKTEEQIAAEKAEAEKQAAEAAEILRQQRLTSLDNATEEQIAALADELGINPAECKDSADVLKKVKAALKK